MVTTRLLDGFETREGFAEHVTALYPDPGRQRNHDVLRILRKGSEAIVMGVEAKVEESLGERIGSKLLRMLEFRSSGGETNLPERIDELVQKLLGCGIADRVGLGDIRYQFLTAAAGILIEAKRQNATAGVLVVHEFGRERGENEFSATQKDVASFIAALSPAHDPSLQLGELCGPLLIAAEAESPRTSRYTSPRFAALCSD